MGYMHDGTRRILRLNVETIVARELLYMLFGHLLIITINVQMEWIDIFFVFYL